MEISEVKRLVVDTIDRATRHAAERRTQTDEASKAYDAFIERTAVPLFKQVANVLRAQGYPFSVFTPAGAVRLASDKTADNYIELALDTTGETPTVSGRTRHARGRQVVDAERALGQPADLGEREVLAFVLNGLEPLVER